MDPGDRQSKSHSFFFQLVSFVKEQDKVRFSATGDSLSPFCSRSKRDSSAHCRGRAKGRVIAAERRRTTREHSSTPDDSRRPPPPALSLEQRIPPFCWSGSLAPSLLGPEFPCFCDPEHLPSRSQQCDEKGEGGAFAFCFRILERPSPPGDAIARSTLDSLSLIGAPGGPLPALSCSCRRCIGSKERGFFIPARTNRHQRPRARLGGEGCSWQPPPLLDR